LAVLLQVDGLGQWLKACLKKAGGGRYRWFVHFEECHLYWF